MVSIFKLLQVALVLAVGVAAKSGRDKPTARKMPQESSLEWSSFHGYRDRGYSDNGYSDTGYYYRGGDGEESDYDLLSRGRHTNEVKLLRRRLAPRRRYISYAALRANNVPCNRRGQSYYGCSRREQSNPYNRGCTQITQCYRHTY